MTKNNLKIVKSGKNQEDDAIENDSGTKNHSCLEATTWTEITMKLNIEGEQQYDGNQQFGNCSEYMVMLHYSSLSPLLVRSFLRRRPPRSANTPIPAVRMTVTSPRVS